MMLGFIIFIILGTSFTVALDIRGRSLSAIGTDSTFEHKSDTDKSAETAVGGDERSTTLETYEDQAKSTFSIASSILESRKLSNSGCSCRVENTDPISSDGFTRDIKELSKE
jgi:hypothetical protein